MSERNGDRARFQKDRKRRMLLRQRVQALVKAVEERAGKAVETKKSK